MFVRLLGLAVNGWLNKQQQLYANARSGPFGVDKVPQATKGGALQCQGWPRELKGSRQAG